MLNSTLRPNLGSCVKTMATPCAIRRSAVPRSTDMTRSGLFTVLAVPHGVLLRDNHFACLKDTFRLLCPHNSLSSASSKYYAHVKSNLLYATCSNTTNMANNYEGNQGFFFSGVGHTVRDPSVRDAFIFIDNNGEV